MHWLVFNHVPSGDKLVVKLKGHKSVSGQFGWVGSGALTLLIDKKPRIFSDGRELDFKDRTAQ